MEKFFLFNEHWQPKLVGELNGQYVKVAKLKGEFVWHKHDNEDELFMVIKGNLKIIFRDDEVDLKAGQFLIVPKGVEHLPIAEEEAHVMLFEPMSVLNTGNKRNDRTVDELEKI